MDWKALLCPRRPGTYKKVSGNGGNDLRSEFEKDYHRIIGSSSFRRLQDKTQVFPLDKSDFIRTRLTHSLEVSSFAKSLGQNIAEYLLRNKMDPEFTEKDKADICDILQCAGLIHDIGNPPFGHFGEEAIRDWFVRNLHKIDFQGTPVTEILSPQMIQDFYHFEGNAQALRQVCRLHFLVNEKGMNLTFGILNTIIKYPVSSLEIRPESNDIREKKMGYFYAEKDLFQEVQEATGTYGKRHPLTFILEAADDIAYRTADIEDAFKKSCFSYDQLNYEIEKWQSRQPHREDAIDLKGMLQHQYQKAVSMGISNPQLYAVQNWVVRLQSALIFCATRGFTSHYQEIMRGSWEKDLFFETAGEWVMEALGDIAYRYAFISKPILQLEAAAATILNFLLDKYVKAAVYYDTEVPMQMMDEKMMALISENYRQTYHFHARGKTWEEKLYLRFLLVTDFISGMTDTYAKDLYQKLNGIT